MEEILTKIKRWGNSYGLLLPKDIINNELKEDSQVRVL